MEKVLLRIEEVLCPKPARGRGGGGLGVSLASGGCAKPLPKLLVREKKGKKVLPETLNLLGPVRSRGLHFCNSLLGLI